MAKAHGVSLSEMTRRIVAESMGNPEGTPTPEPDSALVIEIVRNALGRPVVRCPSEFSPTLQAALVATLGRHLAEIEALIPVRDEHPPQSGDSEVTASAEKG